MREPPLVTFRSRVHLEGLQQKYLGYVVGRKQEWTRGFEKEAKHARAASSPSACPKARGLLLPFHHITRVEDLSTHSRTKTSATALKPQDTGTPYTNKDVLQSPTNSHRPPSGPLRSNSSSRPWVSQRFADLPGSSKAQVSHFYPKTVSMPRTIFRMKQTGWEADAGQCETADPADRARSGLGLRLSHLPVGWLRILKFCRMCLLVSLVVCGGYLLACGEELMQSLQGSGSTGQCCGRAIGCPGCEIDRSLFSFRRQGSFL